MGEWLDTLWENPIYRKLFWTFLLLIVQFIVRHLILRLLAPLLPESDPHFYRVRKVVGYGVLVVVLLMLWAIWAEHVGDFSVTLGLIGAGMAFALQEVIGSVAGWLVIVVNRPFVVGDRIETGEIRGDVVDIGLLRTTLMEIGNWLDGDYNTGRIVILSNAQIFKEPLFNYSGRLHFIWDEIQVPVTYESDWKRALEIMVRAVEEHSEYKALLPRAEEQFRQTRRQMALKGMATLEPQTFVRMTENWLELSLIYPVDTDIRRGFSSDVSSIILSAFAREGIRVASPKLSIVTFPHERS